MFLVTRDNVAEQLQPYHEFECTGEDDQYVVDVDITEEVREEVQDYGLEEALDAHGLESVFEEDPGPGHGLCRYAVVRDGVLVKAVQRTNPNKKWDWWQQGGRWTNWLGFTQAKTHQISFEAIEEAARQKAGAEFDRLTAACRDARLPLDWESWKSISARLSPIDAAREAYGAQPAVKALRASRAVVPWTDLDRFLVGRERYVFEAGRRAWVPYAIVHDGRWHAKGDMGWWGVSSNEDGDWVEKARELILGLPSGTLLTVVDCHI